MKKNQKNLGGFTLVEVLASMAVLLILMLALARVFSESTNAFNKGTTTVNRNASARAAMEIIRKDLEMSVLEPTLAMYKEANTFQDDHDRIGFITMNVSEESTNYSAYVQVQYYVTNVAHVGYTNWVLKRAVRDVGASYGAGVDFMGANTQWWLNQTGFNWNQIVVENVVRFDVWVCDRNGTPIMVGSTPFAGTYPNPFDSTEPYWPNPGDPPAWKQAAFIDIYLQVTSADAMKQGSLLLSAGKTIGDQELTKRGLSLLARESNALFVRITPKMWVGARVWPLPDLN